MKAKIVLSLYSSIIVSVVMVAILRPINISADQSTNQTFRTILIGESLSGGKQDIQDLVQQKPTGRFGNEMMPATDDPKGHWGQITNGLQMSIRFYQGDYTNGQPVSAVIIWRNVGTVPRLFDRAWGIEKYSFDVAIRHDGDDLKALTPRIDPNYKPEIGGGPGPISVQPNTQIRVEQRLDTIFDLAKPGDYEITAERGGARSGVAKFTIHPKSVP
jgi:hypothetical protein